MSNVRAIGKIKVKCHACGKEHSVKGDMMSFRFNQQISDGNMTNNEFIGDCSIDCDCSPNAGILLVMWVIERQEQKTTEYPKYYASAADIIGEFEIIFY